MVFRDAVRAVDNECTRNQSRSLIRGIGVARRLWTLAPVCYEQECLHRCQEPECCASPLMHTERLDQRGKRS